MDCANADRGCVCRLKLKRPQAAKAFRAHIDRMYDEIKAETPARATKL